MKNINIKENQIYIFFCTLILLIGVFLRTKLLIYNPGLSCDEAILALNLIQKNMFELITPLDDLQVSPFLFLLFSKLLYKIVNINYTAYFSDLVLRIIPYLSSIIIIPLFGYLLNFWFKNKFLNLIGMYVIAINAVLISYSLVFKQYSTEALITVLMLIITTKIHFKKDHFKRNCIYMFLLALTPLLSMTSFFVMPGCFIYLFINAYKEKQLKHFFNIFYVFLIPFFIYIILVLIPIIKVHYFGMQKYWHFHSFSSTNLLNTIKTTYILLFRSLKNINLFQLIGQIVILGFIFLKNDYKKFILIISPFIVTYFFIKIESYPFHERFILFLLPNLIILLIYPLSKVILIKKYQYFLIMFIIATTLNFNNLKTYIPLKNESSRETWEYLHKIYDGKTPLLLAPSIHTNLYYYQFYKNKIKLYSYEQIKQYNFNNLPNNEYYILATRQQNFSTFIQEQIINKTDVKLIKHINKNSFFECKYPSFLAKFAKNYE